MMNAHKKLAVGFSLAVGLLFMALGSISTPASAAEPTDDYETIQKSTVRVIARYRSNGRVIFRHGTGWIIEAADKENNAGLGTIVTAAHVVNGAYRITITENGSDDAIVATVKAIDRKRDLAFIEVKDLSGSALTLTQKLPKLGQSLKTFGFTAASDRETEERHAKSASLKSGTLSETNRREGALDYIEHDIPINPGYSGGPLLDNCGRVIGLNFRVGVQRGSLGLPSVAPGVSIAMGTNEIVKFAGDENVGVQRDDSECGEKAAVVVPIERKKPTDTTGTKSSESEPTDQGFSSNQIIAAIVVGLGLLITALAILLFAKKNKTAAEPEPAPIPSKTSVDGGANTTTSHHHGTTISLSGRDPSGNPIDIKFASSEAQKDGLWIGGDPTEVTGHISDDRSNRLISRVHAKIGFDGSNFTVMDNKSTNGTFIGNRKLKPMSVEIIKSRDVIKVADISLTVHVS